MASWGNSKLSSSALQRIEDVNKSMTGDNLPGIRGSLLQDVSREAPALPKPYGLLMNIPRPQTIHISAPVEEKSSQAVDSHDLATKIVEVICNGQSSVNIVIDLVSTATDLDSLVMACWSLLVQDDHKKSFLFAMSATRSTALCVGSNILLPLLQNSETFVSTIQIHGDTFRWLESNFSQSTVVPLMLNEQSVVSQDQNAWKSLLNQLSESQKTEAAVLFCKSIQHPRECHLQSLNTLLDSPPVDSTVVQPVCCMLRAHMNEYSENRLAGKIILTLISFLSASTSHQLHSEVSNLVGQFKGPLRFRHKQALAKVSKQLSSA